MGWHILFGEKKRLYQAEKAQVQGRWLDAEVLFGNVWKKVKEGDKRPSDFDLQDRALRGLVHCSIHDCRIVEALELCKIGRSLGLNSSIFFEFPCNERLADTVDSSWDDVAEDLVAWACWEGAKQGDRSAADVEARLRTLLQPKSNPSRDTKSFLERLVESEFRWTWCILFLAEDARLSQLWAEAARCLTCLTELDLAADLPSRETLLWWKAHCLYLAGDHEAAFESIHDSNEPLKPISINHWLLYIRLISERGDDNRSIEVIARALRRFPSNNELWSQLELLGHRSRRWGETADLIADFRENSPPAAAPIELLCKLAIEMRVLDSARTCADEICRMTRAGQQPSEHVLSFAAAVLCVEHTVGNARSLLEHSDLKSPTHQPCLLVVRLWDSLNSENTSNAVELARQVGVADIQEAMGREWNLLAWQLATRSLFLGARMNELLKWLRASERMNDDVVAMDRRWLATGAARAVAGDGDTLQAVSFAELSQSQNVRAWCARQIVARSIDRWNERGHDLYVLISELIVHLDAARRLGYQFDPIQELWIAALVELNGDAVSGVERQQLPRANKLGDADRHALWAYLEWARGDTEWLPMVPLLIATATNSPLNSWLTRTAAISLTSNGKWRVAADVLKLEQCVMSGVLLKLGASQREIARQQAWEAYEAGNFDECAVACLDHLEATDGDLDADVSKLAMIALRQVQLASEREQLTIRLREALAAIAKRKAATIDWRILAQVGLLKHAHNQIRRKLRSGESYAVHVHALALIATSSAWQQLRAGDTGDALESFLEALGAWASLLSNEQALASFAVHRFRCYQHGGAVPTPAEIQLAVENAVLEVIAGFAKALHRPVQELRRVWDLDVESAKVIARHGGLPVGTNGQKITAGPVLARSLDLVDTVRQLIRSMPERRVERSLDLSTTNMLAALLGLDGAIPNKNGDEALADAARLKRLFSPLGPACVLMMRRQFGEARNALLRLSKKEMKEQDDETRSHLRILLKFIQTSDDRQWYNDQWKQMIIECDLQESREFVAQVPMEESRVREAWKRALKRAKNWDREDEVNGGIAEMAVGRGEILFRIRNKVERMGDSTDHRPNGQRREESIQLMNLAWQLTGSPTVQGPLAENLNLMSVEAFERDQKDRSFSYLMNSLEVKPNSRIACENLSNVVLERLSRGLDHSPDTAVTQFIGDMHRIEGLDTDGNVGEIQSCLKVLNEKGAIPFFNRSHEALQVEDYSTATEMMVSCININSAHETIREAASNLAHRLLSNADGGDQICKRLFESMVEELPREVHASVLNMQAVRIAARGRFSEAKTLLNRAARLDPTSSTIRTNARRNREAQEHQADAENRRQATRLNNQAVEAANQGRFEGAIELLEQALALEPDSTEIRGNIQQLAQAWASKAIVDGSGDEVRRALTKVKEVLGE